MNFQTMLEREIKVLETKRETLADQGGNISYNIDTLNDDIDNDVNVVANTRELLKLRKKEQTIINKIKIIDYKIKGLKHYNLI